MTLKVKSDNPLIQNIDINNTETKIQKELNEKKRAHEEAKQKLAEEEA